MCIMLLQIVSYILCKIELEIYTEVKKMKN